MSDPKGQPPEQEIVKPDFHGNVGKTGEVFNNKNPFFEMAAAAGSKKLKEALEKAKLKAPYTKAYKAENGAVVEVSPFAHLEDYQDNFKTAKVLADNRISVKIRPHINSDNEKNPEYEIGGIRADLKKQFGKAVENNIKKAKRQEAKIIVFKIMESCPYSTERLKERVRGYLMKWEPDFFKEIIIVNKKQVERVKVSELLK